MPTIGFRGAFVAPYNNAGGVTYGAQISAGCPMMANLELRFAEGRLYACDSLAEYIREVIGGTITFGAKYFPREAQVMMFGATTKERAVTITNPDGTQETVTVTSIVVSSDNHAGYVGFAGFAPDVIDGQNMFTAFFVPKVKFSQPNMSLQTRQDNITFQTPQTTGEFLPDDTTGRVVQEVAVCASEAEARAWCEAVCPQPAPTPGGDEEPSGGDEP